jgi:protein-tyrosine phosphatase
MHCEVGMDRTGEVSGSYYMYAQNTTFSAALAFDNSLESRNISIYSQNGFQWYCYNLFYTTQPWQQCRIN